MFYSDLDLGGIVNELHVGYKHRPTHINFDVIRKNGNALNDADRATISQLAKIGEVRGRVVSEISSRPSDRPSNTLITSNYTVALHEYRTLGRPIQ